MPKQYVADASIIIEPKADPIAGSGDPTQLLSSYVATQLDIVRSERVAARAEQGLKLDKDSEFRRRWLEHTEGRGSFEFWVSGILLTRVKVVPAADSNVITISATWTDAKFAANLANAFVKAYIDTSIDLKAEPARQYTIWFDERARALRAEVEARQKKLSDFQSANGIVSTDDRLDIENARLSELSSMLTQVQGQRQDSESRQRQVQANGDAIPDVLQSPVIMALKADLAKAESRRQDLATRLGRSHPDYQAAEAEIANLQNRISRESASIVASIGNTTQINLQREEGIRAALEQEKTLILSLRHQRDEVTVLQNDVAAAKRNLDAVTQRMALSNLEGQAQQANVVPLTTAIEPVSYSSPRILANLIFAGFAGLVLAVCASLLAEIMDRRIRTEEELHALLNVPLLGNVGSQIEKPVPRLDLQRLLSRAVVPVTNRN
jgi:chain length determinant protein EpsF